MRRVSKDGKFLIVPMDHGVSDGPLEGLWNMDGIVEKVGNCATAVVVHKGIARNIAHIACGLIVHLSAGTSLSTDKNRKVLVGNVEEAVRLGADAISVHVNVGGSDFEEEMIADLGRISGECERFSMPLMAMMYARGANVRDSLALDVVSHVARLGAELGADIVKCNYTGKPETFAEVTKKCPVPVVIAGGPKISCDRELLEMVEGAMEAGAAGISIGRNVFQHQTPTLMTKALGKIIFEKWTVEDAAGVLR